MIFSYLNPKCEARALGAKGSCGVFARERIVKGELICLWGGRIVKKNDLDPSMKSFNQRVLQVEEELFLETPEDAEPTDCFNHSCAPNLGFSGQIGLVAMRDIMAGEELCFDYAMCDGSPYDEFNCACGAPNCRGRVTGNDWKIRELWTRYEGYFSPYLARRINELRVDD